MTTSRNNANFGGLIPIDIGAAGESLVVNSGADGLEYSSVSGSGEVTYAQLSASLSASLIHNDSNVVGAYVDDALNTLSASISQISGSDGSIVSLANNTSGSSLAANVGNEVSFPDNVVDTGGHFSGSGIGFAWVCPKTAVYMINASAATPNDAGIGSYTTQVRIEGALALMSDVKDDNSVDLANDLVAQIAGAIQIQAGDNLTIFVQQSKSSGITTTNTGPQNFLSIIEVL